MRIAALIVAAGSGSRAPGDTPKQYRLLAGKSVISRTLEAFSTLPEVCVVISADSRAAFDAAVPHFQGIVTHGGATRSASVRAGLDALGEFAPDLVLIHDAARPFVSAKIVHDVIKALQSAQENAQENAQGAAPALPIVDAIKTLDFDPVDRDMLRVVQTPQGFRYSDIIRAYGLLPDDAAMADDIAVARAAGLKLVFTTGDPANIKLTYPEDFHMAEAKLSQRISVSGTGFDVHKLEAGPFLHLCGVKIEGGLSLIGHSDADVGLHAITDALLGAIGAGDIGDHFPPSDPQWRGASSDRFLAHAASLVSAEGSEIAHIDVTLICEAPKVKPYRAQMKTRIAEILDIPERRVSVKATTTETLGFTGRGEGIAAQACATVVRAL